MQLLIEDKQNCCAEGQKKKTGRAERPGGARYGDEGLLILYSCCHAFIIEPQAGSPKASAINFKIMKDNFLCQLLFDEERLTVLTRHTFRYFKTCLIEEGRLILSKAGIKHCDGDPE